MVRLTAAALILFTGMPLLQDGAKFEKFKKDAIAREKEGAWKKIAWQESAEAALKKGKESGKPILVVLIVGERGQKNAAEC